MADKSSSKWPSNQQQKPANPGTKRPQQPGSNPQRNPNNPSQQQPQRKPNANNW